MTATSLTTPETNELGMYYPASIPRTAGPILVATDRTDASLPALHAAKVLNRSLHSGVTVLVVIEPLPIIIPEPSSLLQPLVITPELEALVRKQAVEQMKKVEDDPAAWTLDVEQGKPPSEIAAAARERGASLVIIGQSHHGIVDRLIDGDTALEILRESETPVLLASREFLSLPRRAVIAVDFSPDSMRAARVALPMLNPDCAIHLVHVRPSVTIFDGSGLWEEEYERVAERQLEEFRKALDAPPTMSVETTILTGKPARALTDFSKKVGADLIVTGTHGTGFIRRILIGSVASGLIRKAEQSLLVVPAPIDSKPADHDQQAEGGRG